jgi:hypothetical protein
VELREVEGDHLQCVGGGAPGVETVTVRRELLELDGSSLEVVDSARLRASELAEAVTDRGLECVERFVPPE